MRDLKEEAKKFQDKLSKIKVCAFDIDGILTDGKVFWQGEEVGWNRLTQTRDGYGLKMLMGAGLKVGVITGGNSFSVVKRFDDNLGLDFIFKGTEDKRQAFISLMNEGYEAHEILYMGDEYFDIPLLKKAGFAATAPEAGIEVREIVDYVTECAGGNGAAREVIDLLRYVQGIEPNIPDFED